MKSKRRMKLLRWSVRIALALVALLAVFILEEHLRGRIFLARYKAELRAKGEKLTLAELDLPRAPTDDNGAPALLAAADELIARKEDWPLASAGVSAKRMIGPGLAQVAWKREHMVDPRTRAAPVERDWAELSAELEKARPILARTLVALRQPILAVELQYEAGPSLQVGHLGKTRALARWLMSATVDDLRRNDLDAVAEKLMAMLRINHLLEQDRLLISELVRYAIAGIAFDLTWAVLQAESWSDDQLLGLQRAWEAERPLPAIAPALETERALGSDLFVRLRDRRVLKEIVPEGSLSSMNWLLWRIAWADQAEYFYLREAQQTIECARRFASEKSAAACREFESDESRPQSSSVLAAYHRWRLLFSGFFSLNQSVLRHAGRHQVQREMVLAAIALKRYELVYGELPHGWEALVPDFLSELPRDYMDGQPLRYRPKEDANFLLYSIGEDGIDDGGNAMPRVSETSFWMWKTCDAVWPQPASEP